MGSQVGFDQTQKKGFMMEGFLCMGIQRKIIIASRYLFLYLSTYASSFFQLVVFVLCFRKERHIYPYIYIFALVPMRNKDGLGECLRVAAGVIHNIYCSYKFNSTLKLQ
jgi:hypothetical protein